MFSTIASSIAGCALSLFVSCAATPIHTYNVGEAIISQVKVVDVINYGDYEDLVMVDENETQIYTRLTWPDNNVKLHEKLIDHYIIVSGEVISTTPKIKIDLLDASAPRSDYKVLRYLDDGRVAIATFLHDMILYPENPSVPTEGIKIKVEVYPDYSMLIITKKSFLGMEGNIALIANKLGIATTDYYPILIPNK